MSYVGCGSRCVKMGALSYILQVLVRPLRELCRHQLDHGAVRHQSRDDPTYVSREEYKYVCVYMCNVSVVCTCCVHVRVCV